MPRTKNLQRLFDDLWTVKDVAERTKRTPMTVHNWRETRGLPTIVIPGDARPTVRFVPDDVRRWARKNGIALAA